MTNCTWDLMRQRNSRNVARQVAWKALRRPFVALLAIELGGALLGAAVGSLTPDPGPLAPALLLAQQPPPKPPNVSNEQIQQAMANLQRDYPRTKLLSVWGDNHVMRYIPTEAINERKLLE